MKPTSGRLAETHRPALIADNQMRKRDERFKDQARHTAQPDPLYDKAHPKKTAGHYRPKDFDYDPPPVSVSVRQAEALPERRQLPSQWPGRYQVQGGATRLSALCVTREVPEEADTTRPVGWCSFAVRRIKRR
ncbi:hypothetical protein [Propionivibrio sp.]|uniref:hypothetical protein n=1 Tax=Propionivibrio sp. TaxID=2212460 RepID=UPI0025E5A6D2|nr:hypothetical protein [Propionivibrio sp.]